MLQLHYSNRFEALASLLVSELGTSSDPFVTPRLVVPNATVASALKLQLARAHGICVGADFAFLGRFWRDVVRNSSGALRRGNSDDRPPPLERNTIHVRLLEALADPDVLRGDEMAPVRNYLTTASGEADELEIRRYQLAEQVAGLFDEYAQYRPGLLDSWAEPTPPPSLTDLAAWQRKLWQTICSGSEEHHLLDAVRATPPGELALPPAVYFFGFSILAPAHLALCRHIAEACKVHLFVPNPCAAFWDDLEQEEEESPALRLWGRAGAESLKNLNELANWDFEDLFEAPGADRTDSLALLQNDILTRAPTTQLSVRERAADTVHLLACPNPRRELEVVATRICALLESDGTLRLNDIAIVLPPAQSELYQAHVATVLGEFGQLPYSAIDMPLSRESRLVEGVELLLDLPLSRFTRPDLLGVLTHPAVASAFSDVDVDDWVQWADALGVVHGVDHRDHADTYIDRDLYNWDQGIRRLALGAFMAGDRSGTLEAVRAGGRALVPEEVPSDLQRSAAQFALLARSLIADARDARSRTMRLGSWALYLDALVTSYFRAAGDHERHSLERVREAISELGSVDDSDYPVGYRTAREFARRAIGRLRGNRGEQLGEGISVLPLSPMRTLPYRVIFACGLSDGALATSDARSPLDVRAEERRRGDLSARVRDRYCFLELLLAARDRLYLSYVNRDEQTGEELSAAAPVEELSHLLGVEVEEHPLRRYSRTYFEGDRADENRRADPNGYRQYRALKVRKELVAHCRSAGQHPPPPSVIRSALNRGELHSLSDHSPAQAARPGSSTELEDLAIRAIRNFLESPLQAWATTTLRLRDDRTDDAAQTINEPFHLERGPEVGLLREVLTRELQSGGDASALDRRYHRRIELVELSGAAPTGVFGDRMRERHLTLLRSWHRQLCDGALEPSDVRLESFGHSREHAVAGLLHPPLSLDHASGTLELYGQLEPIVGAWGSVTLAARPPNHKLFLRGFLDGVVRAAAGERETAAYRVTVVGPEGLESRLFPGWSPSSARDYLGGLVDELLRGDHDYLLPCEAVFAVHDKPELGIEAAVLSALSGRTSCSTHWGPVKRLDDLEPLPEERAAEVIERRFGPFFAGKVCS